MRAQVCVIALAAAFAAAGAGGPEKFQLRDDVPIQGTRYDPNPVWVAVKWEKAADAPYLPIRKEVDAALALAIQDASGKWINKARNAYKAWYDDHQDPVKLYKISAYIGAARVLDPNFEKQKDYRKMVSTVDMGWSMLRKAPNSYEFARRGYAYNSGDTHYHKYGDLPYRLLFRNPLDRTVVVSMVYEYVWRKPIPEFEAKLFDSLDAVSKTKPWRPWDDMHWSVALRMHGQKHGDKASYNKAIAKAQSAMAKTPKGWDPRWIANWIEACKKEREDPTFGRLEGGKYIDDLYP